MRADLMRRIMEMAREGLLTVRRMGVNELRYETELLPGVERVVLIAHHTPPYVRVELHGASSMLNVTGGFIIDPAFVLGGDDLTRVTGTLED